MTEEHVVAATDFSLPAATAVAIAAGVARAFDAPLSLLHVYQPSSVPEGAPRRHLEQSAVAALEELRRDRAGAVRDVDIHALAGDDPAETIVGFASRAAATLLVTGTHARGGVEHVLLGSVAERLVREAPCHVLVARPSIELMGFPRRVVVGVDLSPHSVAAAELAAAWARAFASELWVVHVFDESPPLVTTRTAAAHKLERVMAGLRRANGAIPPGRWRSEITVSLDPAAALCRHAVERDADLLVVGTHGRRGLRRLLLGSVAERVVRRAACPVLVARTDQP